MPSSHDQYYRYDPLDTARWRIGHVVEQRAVYHPYRATFRFRLIERTKRGDLYWQATCPICSRTTLCLSRANVGTLSRGCARHRPWWRHVGSATDPGSIERIADEPATSASR